MLISRFDNSNIEEHVAAFETQNRITLPEEYKRFLMKYNGGRTPKTKFKINKVSSDLRGFYGLGNADEYFNFSKLTDTMNILEEYLSDEMLPIANNDFGDYITISLGKKENGCVFFRYHDRGKKYIKLSDTLCDFVDKCKSEEIGHIRTIEERRQSMIANGREKILRKGWLDYGRPKLTDTLTYIKKSLSYRGGMYDD